MPRRLIVDNIPDGDWHIDHVSGIVPSLSRTEHNVRVMLSEYRGNIDRPVRQRQIRPEARRAIEVSVGASLALTPGGLCTGKRPNYGQNLYQRQTFSLEINDDNVRLCALNKPFAVSGARSAVFPLERVFAPSIGELFRADWERASCIGVDHAGQRNRILIPSAALVWFYYVSSSRTAQALFSPGLADVLDWCQGLVNEESGRRICSIQALPNGYRQSDAWLIARLLCNSTAQHYALNVYRSLARQFADPNIQPPYTLNAESEYFSGFPFTGPTALTCRGIWVPTDLGTRHFYVLQIELCSGAMGFDEVIVESWPEGTPGPRASNRPFLPRTVTELSDELNALSTDEEGTDQRAAVELPLYGERFKALQGKRVRGGTDSQGARIHARVRTETQKALSTGRYGSSAFQRVNYVRQERESPINSAIKIDDESDLLGELSELAWRLQQIDEPGFALRCHYRSVNNEQEDQRTALFYRVSEVSPHSRPWLRIGDRPRRAFVLEVLEQHSQRRFYLMDIEKRAAENESSAMILAYTTAFDRADNTLLESVLAHCAKHRGVWPYADTFSNFTTLRFHHSYRTSEARAGAVSAAIRDPDAAFQMRGKSSQKRM